MREPLERGQLFPVRVARVADHDMVRSTGRRRVGLVRMARQDGDRAVREEPTQRGERRQPDDPGPHDQDRFAVDRAGPQQAVAGDGHRLVEAGPAVHDGVRHGVEHGIVRHHAVRPPASEVVGVAQGPPGADDAAVQVEARRRPAARTVGARRVDAARQTGDARVDDDPRSDGHRTVRPRLDDAPCRLVTEDEGKRPHGDQRRRRPGVVREQVEVAAADPASRDCDARPGRAREPGLGYLRQGSRELGVNHVEHHRAHAASVGAAEGGPPEAAGLRCCRCGSLTPPLPRCASAATR